MSQTVCVLVNSEDVVRLEAIVADRNRALKHVQRARIVLTSSERLDVLSGGDFAFDGVEKANELLMPVLLHAAADHRAVEDVEGCEQCRGPVPLVVVGHSAALAVLQREARLGTVERLDLGLLVD